MCYLILFIIVFKLIHAPTWCFVVTWIMLGFKIIVFLCKTCFKAGRDAGKRGEDDGL